MTEHKPIVQKRIDRYTKKGYQSLTWANCPECFNEVGNHWKDYEAPIFFNHETGYTFCTECGYRWVA